MCELEAISVDDLDGCCGGFTPQRMLKAFANVIERKVEFQGLLDSYLKNSGTHEGTLAYLQRGVENAERQVKRIGSWLSNRM